MAKQANDARSKPRRSPPAATMEDREKQLINLAVGLAEEQIISGTASSQIITHYLKLGSTRAQLENAKLIAENELLRRKAEAAESSKNVERLFSEAIDAMRVYSGRQSRMIKTYSELMRLESFEDRFEYLRLFGKVGLETFGYDRYLNQMLYRSQRWRSLRDRVIIRDDGCDLGHPDYPVLGATIHHLNPITIEDVEKSNSCIFDMENLICTSEQTHRALHYGDSKLLPRQPIDRFPGDTCPWSQKGGTS